MTDRLTDGQGDRSVRRVLTFYYIDIERCANNILKTVQDTDIVTTEEYLEFMYGLSNGMNTDDLE